MEEASCNAQAGPSQSAYFSFTPGDTIQYAYGFRSLNHGDTEDIDGTMWWIVLEEGDCLGGIRQMEIREVVEGVRIQRSFVTGDSVVSEVFRERTVQFAVSDSVQLTPYTESWLPRFGPDSIEVFHTTVLAGCIYKCGGEIWNSITLEPEKGLSTWTHFVHSGVVADDTEAISLVE